ncbi:MAG TPA: (E)-4-hydroxy-3-methylbut-2-enyl-diphosphate synthase [Flavobacteriales bacterium]
MSFPPLKYCPSLTHYERWRTREVRIGNIGIGGANPIRVQSMTTTDTMDTAATVAQSIRMIEAGCELVRITAPSKKDAENLAPIKQQLRAAGFTAPLVADIHFTPNAAEVAARIVEKVRVNPGNYADKKKFDVREYTDDQYEAELERIRERFTPLVRICKEHGTAMRIGTNHGSLSDRILNRYGDTPQGMVESAFEFLRICRDEQYHDIVLSMKASNVQVMVQAYRLLVHRMMELGWDYPLHLGVTEAGDGEDGRVKSAAGIGALLEDGIGDTVRVSLTEEPEAEIPVARALVDRYGTRAGHDPIPDLTPGPSSGERGASAPDDRFRETTNSFLWSKLIERAKAMRSNPTGAEQLMWETIRGKTTGSRIRRQHIIDKYIVDFVSMPKQLVIEIDGDHHDLQQEEDAARTEHLEARGFKVIRFRNDEVLRDPQAVLDSIVHALDQRPDFAREDEGPDGTPTDVGGEHSSPSPRERGLGCEVLDPFTHARRHTREVLNIGARHVPVVIADLSGKERITPATLFAWGYRYSVPLDKWNITDQACDYAFIGKHTIDFGIPGTLGIVQEHATWLRNTEKERHYPQLTKAQYLGGSQRHAKLNIVYALLKDLDEEFIARLKDDPTAVLLIDTYNAHGMAEQRRLMMELMRNGCEVPVIVGRAYGNITNDELVLHSSTDMGPLFLDGLGDGIFIADEQGGREDLVCRTAFGILQATRTRTSKTEYISCPSCGRTLFDLQETTARIRARTSHLKGIKIGIMGCIVNGPGEMADADYGYVGTGPGVITLYKEKEVVKRNVPSAQAVDELIELIRSHGDWVEAVEP